MTLNLSIIAPWGVWQSSDHRLTSWPGGGLVDDYSIKSFILHCLDGTAAITYTGLGKIRYVPVSDWLRKCVRGESRTLEQSLNYIRERANVRLAKFAKQANIYHTFSIGAFLDGRPWAGLITNAQPTSSSGAYPPLLEFNIVELNSDDNPSIIVEGTKQAVSNADLNLLRTVSEKRPRRPEEFRKLLASINRRASRHSGYGKYISPTCSVSYITPEATVEERTYWWGLPQPNEPRATPTVLEGVDMTEIMQIVMRQLKKVRESDSEIVDDEEFDRASREAAERAVKPED